MSYSASVYKVMIASPSDVATERQTIRNVIHDWNAIHSEDKQIVLMPVGWETHSSPDLGERAQAIINEQVLTGADLLVATFWTRIGSPTGKSPSGTVEEIEEHLANGKPAMIYFSSQPVRPDSINEEQYAALRRFKDECFSQGLVEGYDSVSEFKDKFTRQLAQTVLRNFVGDSQDEDIYTVPSTSSPVPHLSDAARELLKEAAKDLNGRVGRIRTKSGLSVNTNGRNFVESNDPRSEAGWESAVQQLEGQHLLRDVGYKREIFAITDDGYQVADQLREQE